MATVEDADDVRAATVAGREHIVTEATEDADIDEDSEDNTLAKVETEITQHIRMVRCRTFAMLKAHFAAETHRTIRSQLLATHEIG